MIIHTQRVTLQEKEYKERIMLVKSVKSVQTRLPIILSKFCFKSKRVSLQGLEQDFGSVTCSLSKSNTKQIRVHWTVCGLNTLAICPHSQPTTTTKTTWITHKKKKKYQSNYKRHLVDLVPKNARKIIQTTKYVHRGFHWTRPVE